MFSQASVIVSKGVCVSQHALGQRGVYPSIYLGKGCLLRGCLPGGVCPGGVCLGVSALGECLGRHPLPRWPLP